VDVVRWREAAAGVRAWSVRSNAVGLAVRTLPTPSRPQVTQRRSAGPSWTGLAAYGPAGGRSRGSQQLQIRLHEAASCISSCTFVTQSDLRLLLGLIL